MLGINKTHNTGSTIKSVCHFITQSINSRPSPPHTYLAITHTSQSSPAALRMSKGDSRPCGPDSRVPAVGPATLTMVSEVGFPCRLSNCVEDGFEELANRETCYSFHDPTSPRGFRRGTPTTPHLSFIEFRATCDQWGIFVHLISGPQLQRAALPSQPSNSRRSLRVYCCVLRKPTDHGSSEVPCSQPYWKALWKYDSLSSICCSEWAQGEHTVQCGLQWK